MFILIWWKMLWDRMCCCNSLGYFPQHNFPFFTASAPSWERLFTLHLTDIHLMLAASSFTQSGKLSLSPLLLFQKNVTHRFNVTPTQKSVQQTFTLVATLCSWDVNVLPAQSQQDGWFRQPVKLRLMLTWTSSSDEREFSCEFSRLSCCRRLPCVSSHTTRTNFIFGVCFSEPPCPSRWKCS